MRGIKILYEDPDLIVVEKSAGVLVCETRRGGEYTVEGALGDYVRKGQVRSRRRVYLVHRLDRDTSGVMMVAKSEKVQDFFRSRWNEITRKRYVAAVAGRMPAPAGVFESYLLEDPDTFMVRSVPEGAGGRFARSEWRVLGPARLPGVRGEATLVEVALHTGRKNQIRVQFADAGHPVAGDAKYGRAPAGCAAPRMCLHAAALEFVHPRTGRRMEFFAAAPDFAPGVDLRRQDAD